MDVVQEGIFNPVYASALHGHSADYVHAMMIILNCIVEEGKDLALQ